MQFFRVYAGELAANERSVLASSLRFIVRDDMGFGVESTLENCNIFIFDGPDSRGRQLCDPGGDARVFRRSIWIDPPGAVAHDVREVRRPLRWPKVLKYIRQIAETDASLPPVRMVPAHESVSYEQFHWCAEALLRDQIGIAAEFVLEDMRADMVRHGGTRAPVDKPVLAGLLGAHLPAAVDSEKLAQAIFSNLAGQK